jgi:MFS family permease
MFSMKILFVISLILFEGGSAICGAAPTMSAVIIGRVIAGIGGCGVYVGGLTYISVLTTPHERPIYLGILMSVWGFGNVLGPIVGGSFAISHATWRWGFYINLPIAAIFAPGILFILPAINAMPDTPLSKKLRMQDWLGIVIFTAFCACFAMAGSFGGTLYTWNSGSEITLWVMTLVLLIAFILITIYHPFVPAESRLMPVQFMRTKDLVIIPLQAFLVAGSMMMSIYYTPLIFQFTKGDGPLQAGVRILPLICMIVFGCLFNGFAMPRFGYYMPWFVVGNILLLVGAALMGTWDLSILCCGITVMMLTGIDNSDYQPDSLGFRSLWIYGAYRPRNWRLSKCRHCCSVSARPSIRNQQRGIGYDCRCVTIQNPTRFILLTEHITNTTGKYRTGPRHNFFPFYLRIHLSEQSHT